MLGAATVAAERQPAPVATSVAAVKATATAARLPVAVTTPASERTKQQTARQQVPRRAAERYPNDPHGIVLPDGSFAPFHTY
jgi:hypothetical protein